MPESFTFCREGNLSLTCGEGKAGPTIQSRLASATHCGLTWLRCPQFRSSCSSMNMELPSCFLTLAEFMQPGMALRSRSLAAICGAAEFVEQSGRKNKHLQTRCISACATAVFPCRTSVGSGRLEARSYRFLHSVEPSLSLQNVNSCFPSEALETARTHCRP